MSVGIDRDGLACRNNNCPDMLRRDCKRYGADGKVINFVPVRNRPDSPRHHCDGFNGRKK